MQRAEAILRLQALQGVDLNDLLEVHGITQISAASKLNKGWAGHVIERYLGLPLNSSRAPNFGSWELKVVPVWQKPDGTWRLKETMAITMLDPVEVSQKSFLDSHLYLKLSKMIIVARSVSARGGVGPSNIMRVVDFQLEGSAYRDAIEADYTLIRQTIIEQGATALTGRLGQWIQPRTKGTGHGSTSRAFYARKTLLQALIFGQA